MGTQRTIEAKESKEVASDPESSASKQGSDIHESTHELEDTLMPEPNRNQPLAESPNQIIAEGDKELESQTNTITLDLKSNPIAVDSDLAPPTLNPKSDQEVSPNNASNSSLLFGKGGGTCGGLCYGMCCCNASSPRSSKG